MTDDAFRELMKSPLDDPPTPGSPRSRLPLLGLGAAVGGAALTAVLVWSLGGFAEPEVVATAATTSTVTAVTVATDSPSHATTFEPQWLYEANGVIFAAVAEIAPPAGNDDPGILGANWSLELNDGSRIPATAELIDHGIFTLEFPAEGASLEDVAGLVANPLSATTEATATTELTTARFPLTLPRPEPDLAIGDTTLVIDEAVLHGAGGGIAWHLDGTADERATLVVAADYFRLGEDQAQAIRTEFLIPGVPLQLAQDASEPARSGTIDLFHLDDPDEPTFRTRFWGDADEEFEVESVTVTWTLTVYRYEADELPIPVEGAELFAG